MKARFLQVSILLFAGHLITSGTLKAQQINTSGNARILVVFVRFQDDTTRFERPTPAKKAWAEPDQMPGFAWEFVSANPYPPFPESSLTDYFNRQSNGRLVLYGTVFPRVYVTEEEKARYLKSDGVTIELRVLSKEILHAVDNGPSIDLSEYDADGDGYIDHVVIVLRRLWGSELPFEGSGIADIRYESPKAEFGHDPTQLKKAGKNSGVYVRYDAPGIILPELDLVRLVAHELGHNLRIARSGHLNSFDSIHGTPENGPDRAGYGLMLGAGGAGDMGGHLILSAVERNVVDDGWIDCTVLESDASVVISDLYTASSANCYKLPVPFIPEHWQQKARLSRPDWASVYLSNHQRIGFYDRLRSDVSAGRLNQHGLMSTGLLATMGTRTRYAVIPADNTLHLSDTSAVYAGDMFGPDTKTQLTPWTRPNINGYSAYPEDTRLTDDHFQAIDNIHYTGEPDGEMGFDYVRDFRVAPVIREESWIGPESGELSFDREFVVAEGAALTINTLLTFYGTLRLERGAQVTVEAGGGIVLAPGSLLEMEDDSRLTIQGRRVMDGTTRIHHNAEIISEKVLSHLIEPDFPQDVVELAVYPNPSRGLTTIRFENPGRGYVQVDILDQVGRQVVRLMGKYLPAGVEVLQWTAGASIASGLYLVRVQTGEVTNTRPVVLAR